MNLERINEILASDLPDAGKEYCILKEIAEDKEAIPQILKMIHVREKQQEKLVRDMNLVLGKADIFIKGIKEEVIIEGGINKSFVEQSIDLFYENNRKYVTHCFKNT
ncbi:MAG: hypothetical protein AAF847_00225 [Bacteroidota bacterium]